MPTAIVPQVIEAPGRGVVTHIDPRHVPEQSWANARNVRFPTGATRVCKTDGFSRVDDSVPPEPIQALWWYVDPLGEQAPTLVRIGTSGAWAGLGSARTAIVTYPADPVRSLGDVVTIDQFMAHLIWADGHAVWDWPGTGQAAVLGGGAPTGKLIEIHKEHILIGNLTQPDVLPWRVAYSVFEVVDPVTGEIDFTGESAGYVEFLEDSTPVTCLKVMGDHCIVHKPNRLYRMIFVGSPDEYLVEGVAADEGAISARAAISVGSFQYYMGRTNVYRLGSFAEPIGDAVWPEIAAAIDWPRANLTYAYRRLEHDEIAWKIPTRGASQPTLTATLNTRDQTWTLTDHDPGTCFTEVPSDALASTAHDDAASPVSPPPVRGCFGQVTGQIQVYGGRNADGAAIHAWLESRHFQAQLTPVKILAVPLFATGTGTLFVNLRAAMEARHPLPAWPTTTPRSGEYALPASQTRPWLDVRASGRLWQVRLESNQLNDDWQITAYGAAVVPGGHAR
jgi:hypothetical protein